MSVRRPYPVTRFNVTDLEVRQTTARIAIRYQRWMQYLFLAVSVGGFALASLFLYARVPAVGYVFIVGGIFLAALTTYKVDTFIDKLTGTVTHTSYVLGIKNQVQFPVADSSLSVKIFSNSKGRYTIVYLVAQGKRYKLAELLSSVTDTVRDCVLDEFIAKFQSFYQLPYDEAF